jgi:hypothetical protein
MFSHSFFLGYPQHSIDQLMLRLSRLLRDPHFRALFAYLLLAAKVGGAKYNLLK